MLISGFTDPGIIPRKEISEIIGTVPNILLNNI
jgi:hypothetical protein